MKNLFLIALIGFIFTAQAQAWTHVAECNTGDAIASATVYTDGENFILQVQSNDDTQAPVEYRTNLGDVNQIKYDVEKNMKDLASGKTKTWMLSQKASFSFGGGTSKAALLNLKLEPSTSNKRTSQLSYDGRVLDLNCTHPEK